MMDVNERSVHLTKKNAELNGVQNVQIYESDALSSVQEEQIAAVLTNPPIRAGKKTIFKFYDEAHEKLANSGELWIVIQKKQGAPSTIEHLKLKFSEVEIVEKRKGYWIIKAIK
jgi:16S rRNA (guanine1207-N2)-methyltransferase